MLYVCFDIFLIVLLKVMGLYCKKETNLKFIIIFLQVGKMTQICPHEIVASKTFSKVVYFPSNEIIIIILKRLTFKFLTTIVINPQYIVLMK
jgi:hypothetical protein